VPTQTFGGPLDLVSTAEIARLLGVSRQRVQQLTKTGGFPPPAATLNMGSVWHTSDVVAWAEKTGRRLLGPDGSRPGDIPPTRRGTQRRGEVR